jgi:hypothetical protein
LVERQAATSAVVENAWLTSGVEKMAEVVFPHPLFSFSRLNFRLLQPAGNWL